MDLVADVTGRKKKKSKQQQFVEAAITAIIDLDASGQTDISDTDLVIYDQGAEDSDDAGVELFLAAWRKEHILNKAIKVLTAKEEMIIVRLGEDACTPSGALKKTPRNEEEAKGRVARGGRPTRGLHIVKGRPQTDLYWLAYSKPELERLGGNNEKTLTPIARIAENGSLAAEVALEMTGQTTRVIDGFRGRVAAIGQGTVDEEEA